MLFHPPLGGRHSALAQMALLCDLIQVVSQRISTVDLSCHSLEEVPEHLFYSQDITYLNLRHNFMQLERPGGLDTFYKYVGHRFPDQLTKIQL